MENCNARNTIYPKCSGPSLPLPSHIKDECRKEGFNHAAFRLLDWPVFAPITSIRVLDLDEDTHQPQWTALFRDGEPHHPVTQEPARNPPVSRMRIVINASIGAGGWQSFRVPGRRPAPLVIANHDGAPVTVAQFVREFASYAQRHHDKLANVLGTTQNPVYYALCHHRADEYEIYIAPEDDAARRQRWANFTRELQVELRSRQDEAAVQLLRQLVL
ncbi:hypothetical protein DL766_005290 [Monosporascus sp. MC13-8B]|uniref:Uncharacterized protein n=1 Tax=Monosporascus cannonballus TaxID=155416 RepID=A0ABY0GUV1_9PEZI|nr:hypothetical protein DL762_010028 [Monosporascus cannonballus]RYO76787.1 hypothetical protein DL763_010174 [Monosporascus cannonballus]RYP29557.1 hypothetical protein DL766_005290 [Monosporascus sp. MC13-8B]